MKVLFFSLLTLIALVCADTPGTRTVVISLATNEDGQIIPYVLHKNSNGYDNPTAAEVVPESTDVSSTDETQESEEEQEDMSSEEISSKTSSSTYLDISWYLVPILISQLF